MECMLHTKIDRLKKNTRNENYKIIEAVLKNETSSPSLQQISNS